MRTVLAYLLIILAVAGLEFACTRPAHAAGITGLNYTAYVGGGAAPTYTQNADGTLVRTYLSSGTVSTIDYNWGGGNILNSNRGDGVIVRFYGYIKIDNPGTYQFGGNADDGIRIKVNNTSVVNSWIESGGAFRSGSIQLAAGTYPIEVMYYENGGGAMINLQWYQNNAWQIVPNTSLATTSTYWASQYPSYMTVGSNPGTMTYGTSAAITTQEQTRVTAFQNRTITNNSIYIDQVGDNNNIQITQTGNKSSISGIGQQAASIQGNSNSITIRQGANIADTNKNEINLRAQGNSNTLNINQGVTTTGASVNSSNGMYQTVDVIGSYNAVTTQQTNTGGIGGHYMETTVNGNNNNVTAKQTDNANKTMFNTVNGNGNTVNATQSGSGQHYLETVLTGNNNTVTAVQTGNTQNRASISITNAGGPGSVDLQQSGGANYNITTTCVTAGGCGTVTVRQ
jgi:hypothetical protein